MQKESPQIPRTQKANLLARPNSPAFYQDSTSHDSIQTFIQFSDSNKFEPRFTIDVPMRIKDSIHTKQLQKPDNNQFQDKKNQIFQVKKNKRTRQDPSKNKFINNKEMSNYMKQAQNRMKQAHLSNLLANCTNLPIEDLESKKVRNIRQKLIAQKPNYKRQYKQCDNQGQKQANNQYRNKSYKNQSLQNIPFFNQSVKSSYMIQNMSQNENQKQFYGSKSSYILKKKNEQQVKKQRQLRTQISENHKINSQQYQYPQNKLQPTKNQLFEDLSQTNPQNEQQYKSSDQFNFNFQRKQPICFKCGGPHYLSNCTDNGLHITEQSKCLNCKQNGHSAIQCKQQRKCTYCNSANHLARDCFSNLADKHNKICNNCNQRGHFVRQCTQLRKCFICQQTTHLMSECPQARKDLKRFKVKCFNCQQEGHYATQCLLPERCHVCKHVGHFARECPRKNRFYSLQIESAIQVQRNQTQSLQKATSQSKYDRKSLKKSNLKHQINSNPKSSHEHVLKKKNEQVKKRLLSKRKRHNI